MLSYLARSIQYFVRAAAARRNRCLTSGFFGALNLVKLESSPTPSSRRSRDCIKRQRVVSFEAQSRGNARGAGLVTDQLVLKVPGELRSSLRRRSLETSSFSRRKDSCNSSPCLAPPLLRRSGLPAARPLTNRPSGEDGIRRGRPQSRGRCRGSPAPGKRTSCPCTPGRPSRRVP